MIACYGILLSTLYMLNFQQAAGNEFRSCLEPAVVPFQRLTLMFHYVSQNQDAHLACAQWDLPVNAAWDIITHTDRVVGVQWHNHPSLVLPDFSCFSDSGQK